MLPGFPSTLLSKAGFGPAQQITMTENTDANGNPDGTYTYDQLNTPKRGTLSGSIFRTGGSTNGFLQINQGGNNVGTGYIDLYNVGASSPFAREALGYGAVLVAGVRYPISWSWAGDTLRGLRSGGFGLGQTAARIIQFAP